VGRYLGALKTVPAYDLAAAVLKASIQRIGLDSSAVDEVILGQAYQNGEYVNIARMALLKAGWPESVTGLTLDQRCCSGLASIRTAMAMIQSGQSDIVVAGGVESMSNSEFYLPGNIKWGIGGEKGMPRGHGDLSLWGLPFYDRIQRARVMSQPEERYGILPSMMTWAETGAKVENVSREECDEWALNSHRKACAAIEAGKFKEEMVPITVPLPKGKTEVVDRDENPRFDTTLERLSTLKPVLGGVCTAGNSSTENDGAAAVVMMSADKAAELKLKPMAYVLCVASAGAGPHRAWETVPAAVNKALKMSGLDLQQMELIEIQEAFAAQVLADLKGLGIDPDQYGKINVNGSGISLGHPIGATGTRVLVSLLHEMQRSGSQFGLETICGGGGIGIAGIFSKP
jgi:acetyl-CoA C-acetyltransferase